MSWQSTWTPYPPWGTPRKKPPWLLGEPTWAAPCPLSRAWGPSWSVWLPHWPWSGCLCHCCCHCHWCCPHCCCSCLCHCHCYLILWQLPWYCGCCCHCCRCHHYLSLSQWYWHHQWGALPLLGRSWPWWGSSSWGLCLLMGKLPSISGSFGTLKLPADCRGPQGSGR